MGWGYPYWNFTVNVSSGDTIPLNVSLYMQKATPNPSTICNNPPCANLSNTVCTNCPGTILNYTRNFTSADQGQWYYQFQLNDTETRRPQDSSTLR